MGTIDKVAWLHVQDGRVLAVRSQGRDLFYLPGGKREPQESDEACLRREIAEELGVELRVGSIRAAGNWSAQADGKPPGINVHLTCYTADYDGELRPCAEIAEFAWLSCADRDRCSLALQVVIDALREAGAVR